MIRRPWHVRLGGADAVTWPVFWVTLLATLIAYLVGNPDIVVIDPGANIGLLIVADALAFAVLALLQPLAHRLKSAPLATAAMLIWFVIAGLARGTFIAYAHVWLGYSDTLDLQFRLSSSVLVLATALIVVTLWHDAVTQHRRSLSALADLRELIQTTREDAAETIEMRQRNTITNIRSRVQREMSELHAEYIGIGIEHLRYLAHEIVRPLSHDLATKAQRITPRELPSTQRSLDWQRLLRDTLAVPPLRPFPLALMPAYLSLPLATHLAGMGRGLLVAVSIFVGVWLVARVFNPWLHAVLQRLSTGPRIVTFTVAMTAMGFIAMVPGWYLLGDDAVRWIVLPATGYFAPAAWLLAATAAAQRQYAETEAAVERAAAELDWEVARANELQWQRQRTLSLILHGPLQAALNAAALRLDAARQREDVSDALIKEVRASVDEALAELDADTDQPTDVALAFERIAGTWAGLCEVAVDVGADVLGRLAADTVAARAVADTVTEACSNAVRHGAASRIEVSLMTEADGLLLVAIRDIRMTRATGWTFYVLSPNVVDPQAVPRFPGRRADSAR